MVAPSGSFNNFPRIADELRRTVDRVVRAATVNVSERIKSSYEGPKGGRIYRVPQVVGRTYHRASAPGEPPAVLFGTLSNSVRPVFPEPMRGFVISSDEKAPHLEYGTTTMEPRPSFAPAAEAEKDDFVRAMKSAIGRVI